MTTIRATSVEADGMVGFEMQSRAEMEFAAHARKTAKGAVILALPGIILAVICLLPYLDKAFTIDDPVFLLSARQILHHPLQPMSFPMCWGAKETCVQSVARWGPGSSQALMGYLLVPVILLGESEWLAHCLQILLVCLAVLEMVRLALRLGFDRVQSLLAGILLVAIPPLLPLASSAMPDIAALALGLTGLEFSLAWKVERRWSRALIGAVALGFAPYARPHLALLIPLTALWLLDDLQPRKAFDNLRRDTRRWMPILLAACILFAINMITRDRGDATQSPDRMISDQMALRNLFSYFVYLAIPIPLTLVWLAVSWRKAMLLLIAPPIPLLIMHLMSRRALTVGGDWDSVAASYGLAALGHLLYQFWRGQDRTNLLLALWILLPLPVIFYSHFPIKYLSPVTPAVIFILLRALARFPVYQARAVCACIATACAAYSCVILRADADFAGCARRAAAELVTPHTEAGEKVWFGGSNGLYWYAQKAGAKISSPGIPGPEKGELLLVGIEEYGQATRDRFPHRLLVDMRHYGSPYGRTVGQWAGLHSGDSALWLWRPRSTNDYELWRIE